MGQAGSESEGMGADAAVSIVAGGAGESAVGSGDFE